MRHILPATFMGLLPAIKPATAQNTIDASKNAFQNCPANARRQMIEQAIEVKA